MTRPTDAESKNAAILALLMSKEVVTTFDMMAITSNYGQRLGDLRKHYAIRCDRKATGNTWTLVRKIPGEQLSFRVAA